MRLQGKVALVTGAGGPMGAAVAVRFAQEGASLVITDISGNRLAGGAREVEAALVADAGVVAKRADVRVRDEAFAVADAGEARFGRIDILANIVGGIRGGGLREPILQMSEQRWDETFELNLKGSFHLVQRVGGGMLERQYGKILNISSVSMAGEYGQTDYGAAKAAVTSLTRSLAMEFAPHVNVNCIAPGMIKTSVLQRTDPEMIRQFEEGTLLKRLGEPDDIANAALFLCSDEASYITGAMLPVSGGIFPAL